MIGSLRGTVIERTLGGEVLVEVGGVGYRVNVPSSTLSQLEIGAVGFLFTHLHVREDAMVLYGFLSRVERDTFEALIGVSGIGPKLGVAMLAIHPPHALRRVVAEDDVESLCLVPGVGKRTAQRLLIELKSKLDIEEIDITAGLASNGSVRSDVREALTAMGFGIDEVREVLSSMPSDGTAEELLRDALKQLARRS